MTVSPIELLASVSRGSGRALRRQIEDQLRSAIRAGVLKHGVLIPSTRDLAKQIGVSRPIVVEAYAQLAAEGYLVVKQGSRPRISNCVGPSTDRATALKPTPFRPAIDFCVALPDLSAFPRTAWLRSMRDVMRQMPHTELGYGDTRGSEVLTHALSEYLGRVRGVISGPERVVITSGYAQGRELIARALKVKGARRVAIEDPCDPELRETIRTNGLEILPIPVDADGMQVDRLVRSSADAVILTPAHQFPTGAVLSGDRRAALLAWLRDRKAIAVEDDYDAEYRYDRAPVGALQGLEPARIVYAGTASKTLAPALRIGWLIPPPSLFAEIVRAKRLADYGGPRIDHHVFADFLKRGELDRHLRRQRACYRARRDSLVESVQKWIPEATIFGVSAGLHATLIMPASDDEVAIRAEALRRGIGLSIMSERRLKPGAALPTLMLGYAQMDSTTIRTGIRQLALAIRATRR